MLIDYYYCLIGSDVVGVKVSDVVKEVSDSVGELVVVVVVYFAVVKLVAVVVISVAKSYD